MTTPIGRQGSTKPEPLLESIRKRPGMYVGGTDALGLSHLVSYALDVVCAANGLRGAHVRIIATEAAMRIECDRSPERWEALRAALDAPETWNAGTTNDAWELIVVAALSSGFKIEVSGQCWSGVRGQLEHAASTEPHACVIAFEPDAQIFNQGFDVNALVKRAGELAAVIPGLQLELVAPATGRRAVFCYPAGMADLVVERVGIGRFPTWHQTFELRGISVDAAVHVPAIWGGGVHQWVSFANTVPTVRGGNHVKGLRSALERAWGIDASEISRLALGAISIHAPRDQLAFDGPMKDALRLPWLEQELVGALEQPLHTHLERFGVLRPAR